MKPLDEDWKKRMKKLMETVFAPYAPKNLAFKTEIEGMEKMNKALDKMLFDLEAIEPFTGHPKSKEFALDSVEWDQFMADRPKGKNIVSVPIDGKTVDEKINYAVYGPDWKSAGF